jgi:NADH-quinone oxidoreductase subunit J
MNLIFYIAGAIAVFSSIMAITNKNAIHGLLYLITSLLAVSVIYYILGTPLVAALEVLVYAGAIMVLFIFVVMMLNIGMEEEIEKKWLSPVMWIIPSALAAALLVILIVAMDKIQAAGASHVEIGPKKVGIKLFTTYLLAVEMSAMLLMAGIVGTYHLGKSRKKSTHRFLEKEIKKKTGNNADSVK